MVATQDEVVDLVIAVADAAIDEVGEIAKAPRAVGVITRRRRRRRLRSWAGGPTLRTDVHPIETASYAILRERLDTTDLPPLVRAVVERVVHTSADPSWAGDLVCDEDALRAGREALAEGAPLVVDVRMVAAGITTRPTTVALDLAPVGLSSRAARVDGKGLTRSSAGMRAAVAAHPEGAVWVVGNAPTALVELVRCAREGLVRTPLVIGMPVGFVGAVAAKAALRASGLPAVSNRSERGGAAVAAAAVNALLYADPAA